jgi:hypothetical protein
MGGTGSNLLVSEEQEAFYFRLMFYFKRVPTMPCRVKPPVQSTLAILASVTCDWL